MEAFLRLTPEEREAIDNFAFSQRLLSEGSDAARRFALLSLDCSVEIALRSYLLKKNVTREKVDSIKHFHELINECEAKGLQLPKEIKSAIYDLHEMRNRMYHGRIILIPSLMDLKSWSNSTSWLLRIITNFDPQEYFKSGYYERISLRLEDLTYVDELEKKFRIKPPYVKKLTWWSEIQRDVVEAGEKWDLYIHYRPRWPFFIPTLILVKCNPYDKPVSRDFILELESKASFLKTEKKVWRVWLGVVSSSGFDPKAKERAELHESRTLGLILVNPKDKEIICSGRGESRKASKWLITGV